MTEESGGHELYKTDSKFRRVIDATAAYNAHYFGNQSIADIARQSGKSETTIRRYINLVASSMS